MNSARVCWLHHSTVYHRAGRRDRSVTSILWARCGVLLSGPRFRCQEATEHQARRLGLRRCRKCWRDHGTDSPSQPV